MKELQKYYAETEDLHIGTEMCDRKGCQALYLASEADAHIAALKSQHAEEIERLTRRLELFELTILHVRDALGFDRGSNHDLLDAATSIRKQAERYEKLRRLNVTQFAELWRLHLNSEKSFDSMVDELR